MKPKGEGPWTAGQHFAVAVTTFAFAFVALVMLTGAADPARPITNDPYKAPVVCVDYTPAGQCVFSKITVHYHIGG